VTVDRTENERIGTGKERERRGEWDERERNRRRSSHFETHDEEKLGQGKVGKNERKENKIIEIQLET
jgi:hypothetical protein